jgi:TatD DNase family protein
VIDTHAHLDACDDQPERIVARAREAGVGRVITIGTGIVSSERAVALAETHREVFAAVGIDPHQASSEEASRLAELRPLLSHPRVVAVGETGLDGYHHHAEPIDQRRLLDEHLALADELSLPVVIHSREAESETAAALEPFRGTVVLHCFSSPRLLDTALERGYYVSFAGNVTFPRATDLRLCATLVPDDRILAETDSPYLAPQPLRGRRNEPANVIHTLATLADVRGQSEADLAAAIDRNAAIAFGLS